MGVLTMDYGPDEKPESAEVWDLYQAAYLLTLGCNVELVECVPMKSGVTTYRFVMSGIGMQDYLQSYASKEAVVNLYAFRNAYYELNTFVYQARKRYEISKRRKQLPKLMSDMPLSPERKPCA
jgi:hypothetical protein